MTRISRTVHNPDCTERDAWDTHSKLVRILNSSPPSLGFKTIQGGQYSVAALKPMIYEMLMTEQLTVPEVVAAVKEAGMTVSEKFVQKIIRRSSWKSEQVERRSKAKKTRKREKYIAQSNFDAEIVSVCRALPLDEIDSRILVRYWEIIGLISPHENSIFLATTDLMNALDRFVSGKGKMKLSEVMEADQSASIRDEAEVKDWVRFA